MQPTTRRLKLALVRATLELGRGSGVVQHLHRQGQAWVLHAHAAAVAATLMARWHQPNGDHRPVGTITCWCARLCPPPYITCPSQLCVLFIHSGQCHQAPSGCSSSSPLFLFTHTIKDLKAFGRARARVCFRFSPQQHNAATSAARCDMLVKVKS